MSTFEALLTSVARIKNLEQWAYTLGYVNAEYAHNFITSKQYDILFDLLQAKRSVINA